MDKSNGYYTLWVAEDLLKNEDGVCLSQEVEYFFFKRYDVCTFELCMPRENKNSVYCIPGVTPHRPFRIRKNLFKIAREVGKQFLREEKEYGEIAYR